MPLLVLARHASTPSALQSGTDDAARPLGEVGFAQARRMGLFLREYAAQAGAGIDTVIASAALRTVQTAHEAADGLGLPRSEVREDPALYQAFLPQWTEAIETITTTSAGALIVGHEPTLTEVVAHCSGMRAVPSLRPGTVVIFELGSWQQTAPYGEPRVIRDFFEG